MHESVGKRESTYKLDETFNTKSNEMETNYRSLV